MSDEWSNAMDYDSQTPPAKQERADTRTEAERLAQRFHEIYEDLAPSFGYETRKESAKPWAEVPERNKLLMTAVCRQIISAAASRVPEPQLCGICGMNEAYHDPEIVSHEFRRALSHSQAGDAAKQEPVDECCDCTDTCQHNSPHCMMDMSSEKLARIAKVRLLPPAAKREGLDIMKLRQRLDVACDSEGYIHRAEINQIINEWEKVR